MQYYVYFITNQNNNVLYVGVTNNLYRRLQEHRDGVVDSFTKKYRVYKLVYFEATSDIKAAIEREKQIKSWSRKRKNTLIESTTPLWEDLTTDWD